MAENKEQLWDVEVYNSGKFITTITVPAKSPQEASNKAVQGFTVKIKKNYGKNGRDKS